MRLEIDVLFIDDDNKLMEERGFVQKNFDNLTLKSLYTLLSEVGYLIEDAFHEAKGTFNNATK